MSEVTECTQTDIFILKTTGVMTICIQEIHTFQSHLLYTSEHCFYYIMNGFLFNVMWFWPVGWHGPL